MTVLASIVWTVLCAAFIFSWQVMSWLRDGVWNVFPISSVILTENAIYVTASEEQVRPQQLLLQNVIDWLLGIPVVVPLVIASALLVGFHARLSVLEKQVRNPSPHCLRRVSSVLHALLPARLRRLQLRVIPSERPVGIAMASQSTLGLRGHSAIASCAAALRFGSAAAVLSLGASFQPGYRRPNPQAFVPGAAAPGSSAALLLCPPKFHRFADCDTWVQPSRP